MRKLSDNHKLLILGGATLLLCGGGFAGIWWARGRVTEERDKITAMREQIKAAEQKINQIPAAERDVIILRENVHEYVKILPEEREQINFMRIANQFINQSGVQVKKFLPGKITATDGGQFERYTYSFTLEGTLWQFMKFINLFENYERFVSVQQFKLDTGAGGRQQNASFDSDVVHSISLTVETYVYKGSSKTKDVVIPNYNSKRDALRDDILRNLQAIPKERYDFKDARGRRDIFIDPREIEGGNGGKGLSVPMQQQRKLIENTKAEIARLKELNDRSRESGITIFEKYNMDRTLRAGIEKLAAEVEDINQKRIISYQPYKLTWTKEIMQPLEILKRDAAKGAADTEDRFLSEPEMNELLAAMKDDLAAGELGAAKERYETVQEKVKVPHADPRYNLAFAIQTLYHRAKLALEFSSLKLAIAGVCVNENGRSGLILNGEVMEEGDYVNDDLFIKAVGREQVEFVYKGFTLIKTW